MRELLLPPFLRNYSVQSQKLHRASVVLSLIFTLPYFAFGNSTSAQAQPEMRAHEGLRQELHLTDQQREQLRGLRESKHRKEDLLEDARTERTRLRELLMSEDANEQEIIAQLAKVNKALTDANTQRVKHLLEIRKVLTKDQRDIIREHIQEFKNRRFNDRRSDQEGFQGPRMHRAEPDGERFPLQQKFRERLGDGNRSAFGPPAERPQGPQHNNLPRSGSGDQGDDMLSREFSDDGDL